MFSQISGNKPFKVGVGQKLQPIVTLKDEKGDYAYIARDAQFNYVLYLKETRQYYTPTHLWFPEAVAAMQMLPTPDRLLMDEKGNPIPPELGELPENWDVSRDTPGKFIFVQYELTGNEIGSRKLTGKQIKAKAIPGVKNAYTVTESEDLLHLIGQRITFDPVQDKIFVG